MKIGCGQRTLEGTLGFGIRNYDPCIVIANRPAKARFRVSQVKEMSGEFAVVVRPL